MGKSYFDVLIIRTMILVIGRKFSNSIIIYIYENKAQEVFFVQIRQGQRIKN